VIATLLVFNSPSESVSLASTGTVSELSETTLDASSAATGTALLNAQSSVPEVASKLV
jgi:hypothetical protein